MTYLTWIGGMDPFVAPCLRTLATT